MQQHKWHNAYFTTLFAGLMACAPDPSTSNEHTSSRGLSILDLCDDNTVEQTYGSGVWMAGCAGSETQLDAEDLCGPLASLCTLDQYIANGGTTTSPNDYYWIASCMIDNGTAKGLPTQAVCPSGATGSISPRIDTDWTYAGSALDDSGNKNTGVVASSVGQCHRLGTGPITDPSDCAYAENYGSWATVGAMCCIP